MPPKCPSCKKAVVERDFAPFCCERCKLVDLQKWLGGVYAIPGAPVDVDTIEVETKLDEDP